MARRTNDFELILNVSIALNILHHFLFQKRDYFQYRLFVTMSYTQKFRDSSYTHCKRIAFQIIYSSLNSTIPFTRMCSELLVQHIKEV